MAVHYPDQANDFCFGIEERSFWFNYRNRFIVETVRRFPPDGPIVDVGGGNGYVSLGLRQAGFQTILVEPGEAGARNARSRGLEPVICSTLEGAGFPPASLDAVGLFDVLEHLEDDYAFLRTIRGMLKPGGRFYLTVPAFRALWSTEDVLVGHHHRYRLATLKKRLTATGFTPDYATYLFSPLPVPLFLLRSLPARLGRRQTLDPDRSARELAASGLLVRAIAPLLDVELFLVRRQRRIPIGTSCLVAAHAV